MGAKTNNNLEDLAEILNTLLLALGKGVDFQYDADIDCAVFCVAEIKEYIKRLEAKCNCTTTKSKQ